MQDDPNQSESALRPGEVVIALPAAPDAGVYFIGTIRTPWRAERMSETRQPGWADLLDRCG